MQGMGMGNMAGMGGMNGGMRQANQAKQLGTGNSAMQASKMGTGLVDDSAKQWCVLINVGLMALKQRALLCMKRLLTAALASGVTCSNRLVQPRV